MHAYTHVCNMRAECCFNAYRYVLVCACASVCAYLCMHAMIAYIQVCKYAGVHILCIYAGMHKCMHTCTKIHPDVHVCKFFVVNFYFVCVCVCLHVQVYECMSV